MEHFVFTNINFVFMNNRGDHLQEANFKGKNLEGALCNPILLGMRSPEQFLFLRLLNLKALP